MARKKTKHKVTASQRRKLDGGLVKDRVKFLQHNAYRTRKFATRAEALDFAATQMVVNGLDYDVKPRGKTVTLRAVDGRMVSESQEMQRIRKDLRIVSNGANGRKAQALVNVGRREAGWDFAVGESPK